MSLQLPFAIRESGSSIAAVLKLHRLSFHSAFGGYAAGLIATIVVMNVFKVPPPPLPPPHPARVRACVLNLVSQ